MPIIFQQLQLPSTSPVMQFIQTSVNHSKSNIWEIACTRKKHASAKRNANCVSKICVNRLMYRHN